MLFSHVKISRFRAKAHVVFHWCLYHEKKILSLTSELRFTGTFSEDLFPNFSLDNSWVSTVKVDLIRS